MWKSSRKPASVFLALSQTLTPKTLSPSPPFSFLSSSSTFCTATSSNLQSLALPDDQSFTVNYLINNFGFTLPSALSASNYTRFRTSENADSVVAFFRNHGFSDLHLRHIIRKFPKVLTSNPQKTLLPKLLFLQSKGASHSQLINIVIRNPGFLLRSLHNCLIPNFNFLSQFLLSDDSRTILTIQRNPFLLSKDGFQQNITFLLDIGFRKPQITVLLRNWPSLINCSVDGLRDKIDEVRELGIDPSKANFVAAMHAKELLQSLWDSKVELYKKWRWTDEAIREAFVKHPYCMILSESKIDEGLDFFVNQLGWEPLVLARHPVLLSLSLKKRIVPRASVLQFLLSRDLIKSANLVSAYYLTEKKFLQKYVTCFKSEAPQLFELYEEKMNLSAMDRQSLS